jgi:pyruvate carboxylase
MPPADFSATAVALKKSLGYEPSLRDTLSYLLYPRVFDDFANHQKEYSDTSVLPTPVFFYGLQPGEETEFEVEPGKTFIAKLITIGEPHPDGHRTVFFEFNGQPRDASVLDRSLESEIIAHPKADPSDPSQIGAPMPGLVVNVAVQAGDQVAEGQKLLTLEAMKMEMTMYAPCAARVAEVLVKPKTQLEAGDLLVRLE